MALVIRASCPLWIDHQINYSRQVVPPWPSRAQRKTGAQRKTWRNNVNKGTKGIAGSSRVAVRSIHKIGERLYGKGEQQPAKKATAAAERAQEKETQGK